MVKQKKVWNQWQAVSLKSSFSIAAILGFFISIYFIYPISSNFGIASMFVFVLMFIATLVSMEKAPIKNGKTKNNTKKKK
jgi:hypothetical protein